MSRRCRLERAFTLIELLAVIGIIVVLVGMVLAGAGLAQRQADRNRAKADMQKIETALNRYIMDFNKYPSVLTNSAVWQRLTNYVSDLTRTDPWGQPYRYNRLKGFKHLPDGRNEEREREDAYELRSAGPDGIFDTADDIVTSRTE